jgi:hypothetical protein
LQNRTYLLLGVLELMRVVLSGTVLNGTARFAWLSPLAGD